MRNQPGARHIPVRPARIAGVEAYRGGHCPDIGVVTGGPSGIDAQTVLGSGASGDSHVINKVKHDLMHLRQSGGVGRPVVLLQIDVYCIV